MTELMSEMCCEQIDAVVVAQLLRKRLIDQARYFSIGFPFLVIVLTSLFPPLCTCVLEEHPKQLIA